MPTQIYLVRRYLPLLWSCGSKSDLLFRDLSRTFCFGVTKESYYVRYIFIIGSNFCSRKWFTRLFDDIRNGFFLHISLNDRGYLRIYISQMFIEVFLRWKEIDEFVF